jgi:hypothetical protein
VLGKSLVLYCPVPLVSTDLAEGRSLARQYRRGNTLVLEVYFLGLCNFVLFISLLVVWVCGVLNPVRSDRTNPILPAVNQSGNKSVKNYCEKE